VRAPSVSAALQIAPRWSLRRAAVEALPAADMAERATSGFDDGFAAGATAAQDGQ